MWFWLACFGIKHLINFTFPLGMITDGCRWWPVSELIIGCVLEDHDGSAGEWTSAVGGHYECEDSGQSVWRGELFRVGLWNQRVHQLETNWQVRIHRRSPAVFSRIVSALVCKAVLWIPSDPVFVLPDFGRSRSRDEAWNRKHCMFVL